MNEYIANRMNGIDASGIRKVFDLAAKMKNPINLSIGQPHFDVPEEVKNAAEEAIKAGKNRYTPTQGIETLRNALRTELKSEFGWSDAMERPMLITSGVSGALKLAFAVTINPGDEVILFDPYFVMYKHLTALYGGVPVLVDTYPDFEPKPEDIEKVITPKSKIICLNSPCNPTGAVFSKECLTAIAEIARKHNLLVISDEIYNFYCYDGAFESMAKYYEKTLLMRGFSKSHSMTGWRMGWVTGPKDVVEKMTILQQYSFVCAPSVSQEATLVAMQTNMDHKIAEYKIKRDLIYNGLKAKFNLVCPHGAFYAFVPVPEKMSSTDFVTKAIENNVLLIPGNVFSEQDTHFRLSFAAKDEDIMQGIDIINSLA